MHQQFMNAPGSFMLNLNYIVIHNKTYNMKKLTIVIGALMLCFQLSAQHSLEQLWQTDTTLKNPESVRYDAKSKILYVSSIGDFDKEGTGFICKMGLDGKMLQHHWVTGLAAPKGLGLYGKRLYAAENKAVVVIDVDKGTIIKRIEIDGAKFLNDITIDSKGTVFVSDSQTGKVHAIQNDQVTVYLENLKDVNGLLAIDNSLYILTGTSLQKSDAAKKVTQLLDGIEGGADGIEKVKDGEFIVTGWEGTVYYVNTSGSKQVLSDTRATKTNAADLGYDAANKIIYIPEMTKHRVTAYKLK
jgi:sugar lactone lactonase YvrE